MAKRNSATVAGINIYDRARKSWSRPIEQGNI